MLNSPAVSPYHAQLISNGRTWWLSTDPASDVWVDGQRVTTIALTGATTAWLGPRGEFQIRLEPVPEQRLPEQRPTAPEPDLRQASGPYPVAPQQALSQQSPAQHSPTQHSPGQGPPARPSGSYPVASQPYPTGPQPTARQPYPPGPAYAGPGPGGPPGADPGFGQTLTGREQLAVLVTRIGDTRRVFPVGTVVRVGRDPSLELVSVNPLVSRQVHGIITSDERGATYTDQSRRGTFHNGRKLRGPLRITESVVLRLGDPATGEELGITPPLSSAQIEHNRGRRLLRGRARVAAVAVAAVVVAAGLAAFFLSGSPGKPAPGTASGTAGGSPLSGGTSEAVLQHAEQATVRLLLGSPARYTGWGSGTVISASGLILTNAHVAQPQAPGAAVALGLPASQLEPDPPYLTVEVTTGPASPVMARYRARTVAVDGYLDLAVVQIYATSSGAPVSAASLHLPYLALGSDTAVQLDQQVTVLGFPGVADSDSITVTSGVISTFVPDPLGHISDPRYELETTARLAHGNSGGAAINNAGQLIGVPSLEVTGEGGDLSWRLRSVAEARLLVAAATSGTAYRSHILTQLTGAERVAAAGVGATPAVACAGSQALTASQSAVFGVAYAQAPRGLDLALLVALPGGAAFTVPTGGLPQGTATASTGCFALPVTARELGLAALPSGTYHLQLYGGPNLTPIGPPAAVMVNSAGP